MPRIRNAAIFLIAAVSTSHALNNNIADVLVLDPRHPRFGQPVLGAQPADDTTGGGNSATPLRPLWTADWTSDGATGTIPTSSACAGDGTCVASVSLHSSSATLTWSNIVVADGAPPANVSIVATLAGDEGGSNSLPAVFSVSMVPTFAVGGSGGSGNVSLGLYSWGLCLAVAADASNENLNILLPTGFGILARGKDALPSPDGASHDYPSSATMQFQAWYWSQGYVQGTAGLYVGAHDPSGSSKTLSYWTTAGNGDAGPLSFEVSALVPDAAVALSAPFSPSWPVVLAGLPAGSDWFDASAVYRAWVLRSGAAWTKDGPANARLPQWYRDVQTFVNTHWQQNDIFNVTGGDPAVVIERVGNVTQRLGLAPGQLALHWYEWDTLGYAPAADGGSEYYGACPPESGNCGFDTNYPDYFPTRSGFAAAQQQVQEALGVPVFPYINGRIHDQNTTAWAAEGGGAAGAAKSLRADQMKTLPSAAAVVSSDLDFYNESYGSKANFSVMCPAAAGWQQTIAGTVGGVVATGSAGVYVDQIAASSFVPCFDPSHGHALGGGDHWVQGYRNMLAQSRDAAAAAAAADPARPAALSQPVLITESNAEPFMGAVDVLLALYAYNHGDWARSSAQRSVPVFPAVYGGYYAAAGAEFFQTDLTEESADVWCAKLTQQLLTGAQLGWASLGGRDNQDPAMGLYELLMESGPNGQYDAAVAFWRSLATARAALGRTFWDGHASRDLDFTASFTANGFGESSESASSPARRRELRRVAPRAERGWGGRVSGGGGDGGEGTVETHGMHGGEGAGRRASQPVVGVEYDAVMGAVWVDDAAGSSLTAVFVGVAAELNQSEPGKGDERQAARVTTTCLDAGRYGLAGADSVACAAGASVAVASVNVTSGAEVALGTFPACCVDLHLEVGARSVAAVRLRLATNAASK